MTSLEYRVGRARPLAHEGSPARSTTHYISLALVATALYGDLLKRVLPPTAALLSLYVVAAFLLLKLAMKRRRWSRSGVPAVSTLSGVLIAVYYAQLCTSFGINPLHALMSAIYMILPLAFLYVIPRACPDFDIRSLALFTTILVLPIHLVGLIQEFFDPEFLVSTAYSENGGVIARNFVGEEGSFNRYPSLFASADRYSAVSCMNFFLSFVLTAGDQPRSRTPIDMRSCSAQYWQLSD